MNDKKRKILARKELARPVTPFVPIDLKEVPYVPSGMTRAFRNTRFTVMVYDNSPTTSGPATRVMVQKHDNTPLHNHWASLQKIKNEIFGEETVAVEYYPAASQLIDDYNIYWLWIFPPGVLPIPIVKGK